MSYKLEFVDKAINKKLNNKDLKKNTEKYKKLMDIRKALKNINAMVSVEDEDGNELRECDDNVTKASEYLQKTLHKLKEGFSPKSVDKAKTSKKIKLKFDKQYSFVDYKDEDVGDGYMVRKPYMDTPEFVEEFLLSSTDSTGEVLKNAKEKLRGKLQLHRIAQRKMFTEKKTFRHSTGITVDYDVIIDPSGIQMPIFKEGFLEEIKRKIGAKILFKAKKPLDTSHHVGVEIEFISKTASNELAVMLFEAGLGRYCELKGDGSLRADGDYKHCHELAVIFPESQAREIITRVIDVLDRAVSKVNKTCGLHVHLDMRSRDHKLVFNNLVKAQDVLFDMNPVTRKRNTEDGTCYSKKIEESDFTKVFDYISNHGGGKYWGINPRTVDEHQTLEVRLHSGSTNADKIINWITILTAIANKNTLYKTEIVDAETFAERYKLEDTMLAYMKERIDKFKDKSGKHIYVEESA